MFARIRDSHLHNLGTVIRILTGVEIINLNSGEDIAYLK